MKQIVFLCVLSTTMTAFAGFKSTGDPRYDGAVKRGLAFLDAQKGEIVERETSLIAYTLLKAGESANSAIVKHGIEEALKRTARGHGALGYDHIYLAGVDAMLLADADPDQYKPQVQQIVNYVQSVMKPDGSWAGAGVEGDTSMNQYGMLAIWAGQRIGCQVSGPAVERNAQWHLKFGNADGGWAYRPPSSQGSGSGASTHNCTMAGAGSLGIARFLLHGGKKLKPKTVEDKKFGILAKVKNPEAEEVQKPGIPGYNPKIAKSTLDGRIEKSFRWATVRFHPEGHQYNQKQYFFYAMERAAALHDFDASNPGWFKTYGDVLLSMQADDGSWTKTTTTPRIGTCFAILYFVRSTKQILDKEYGTGIQAGGRGLESLFGGKEKKKKELGPLDELLGALESADLSQLDNMEEIVEKVEFGSREELIGQVDKLKKLLKSKDATHRQTAYYALGRTGDFALIPDMLEGLRDPNLAVNTEALQALRYIARKPNGFGMPTDPLSGGSLSSEEQKLVRANNWRTQAAKKWGEWYRKVRPYEEGGGFDELQLLAPSVSR